MLVTNIFQKLKIFGNEMYVGIGSLSQLPLYGVGSGKPTIGITCKDINRTIIHTHVHIVLLDSTIVPTSTEKELKPAPISHLFPPFPLRSKFPFRVRIAYYIYIKIDIVSK